MTGKQATDRAALVITALSGAAAAAGGYLFYLGTKSVTPDYQSPEDSANLPAEDSENADDSPDPAGDE